jgi:hypothetical protein
MLESESIIRRVAEIGALACELGQFNDAEIVFNGISAFAESPEAKTAAQLGMASVKISLGDFEPGIQLLSKELEAMGDDNMEALAILIFALHSNGQYKEAESLMLKIKENPAFKGSIAEEALLSMRN